MGKAARTALRATWGALSPLMGSSHPHYRQGLWFPTRQGLDGVALSERFSGMPEANGFYRRGWDHLGVVAVRGGAMDELLDLPGARPAGAFTIGKLLVVGELVGPEPFGRMTTINGDPGDIAHGFRLGDGPGQYAVGVKMPDGDFVTPSPEDVYTMGPVDIDTAIREGSGFANINFS